LTAAVGGLPRAAVDAKLIRLITSAAVCLGVFLSGFVLREPAPYEIYMAGLMAAWALFGLRLSRNVMPLLVLLVLFFIGGLLSLTQLSELGDMPLYMGVTLFLGLTAVFFAAITEAEPSFFSLIFHAWIAAAILTAALGMLSYFNAFPGAATFTRYGRATGGFADPNVFGPFLALPATYLLHRLMTQPAAKAPLYGLALSVIVIGILLSFSRGAWGLFAVSGALLTASLFLHSNSGAFRLRIAMMSLCACVLLVLVVVVALQIPAIAELFSERAHLVQYYDGARLGRFARFPIGFAMAMEHPLGIGPMVFGQIFGEDTHNIWLKVLLDYSWLGFAAYLLLIVWTLAAGFRILFRNRSWQPFFLCAYIVFAGHVALGMVIDTDHWRHFYLLLGLVWGGIALEARERSDGASRTASMHQIAAEPRQPEGLLSV
jgi:O-antigen ligase